MGSVDKKDTRLQKRKMRIVGLEQNRFFWQYVFQAFIFDVSFLKKEINLDQWLKCWVYSIEKEAEIWMSHI